MIFGKDKTRFASLEKDLTDLTGLVKSFRAENVQLKQRGYNMAKVDRLKSDWSAFAKAFNYDIRVGGSAMLARGRELYQNDPYAKKIVKNFKKGILGENGFTLRNKAGEWKQLGNEWKFVLDTLANSKINEAWYRWGVEKYCSIEGDETFRAYCSTILQSCFVDGEIFIKKLAGKKFNPYGFTTQVITSEQVDWNLNKNLPNGNFIVMGVEVTPYWQKVGYWIRKHNPKSEIDYNYNWTANYDRVDADKIIHLYNKEAAHQLRGITQFAPVGIRLKMLYGIEEAALTRVRSVASVPWMLEDNPNILSGGTLAGVGQSKDANGNQIVELEPGQIFQAPKGYQVKSMEADFPGSTYGPFVEKNLHSIAAGVNQAHASVSGDWLGYNYSVSRAAQQDERDEHKDNQSWFAEQFVNVVFAAWLEMALFSTALTLPVEKYDKFNHPYWFGRRWPYANPTDEKQSNILGLQSFQDTFESILADKGLDLEEQLDQIVAERNLFKNKGLDDFYTLLMTKYVMKDLNANQNDSAANNSNDNNSNGNGNGKAKHFIGV